MNGAALTRYRHRIVSELSARPRLYFGARRLLGRFDELCVNANTEIVIEGYPRSANSTTVFGFLDRQTREIRVAHHKHHVAQLLQAARLKLPAVMLVRAPEEAALSYLALLAEGRARVGLDPLALPFGAAEALFAWRHFYKSALPVLDSLVIAPFTEVTRDLGPVVQAVNRKFGVDFEHAPAASTPRSDALGWHARPNDLRNQIKIDLAVLYRSELARAPRLGRLRDDCINIHEQLLSRHERDR